MQKICASRLLLRMMTLAAIRRFLSCRMERTFLLQMPTNRDTLVSSRCYIPDKYVAFLGLVAKYYVVDRLKEQSEAFTRGLWEVIDGSWLRLFNEPELQVLISGPSDGKIDVADMRSNARYAGGFTGIDRTVNRFWNVVASFNSKQQASLLRFVTSCERPPPLGFACMNPPFTIQRVGILRDADKLPSASTCFNTLKLPTYSSEKVLRERLIYAIESGSGFELS
jgi:ubiquitin-protein ligase E3 C